MQSEATQKVEVELKVQKENQNVYQNKYVDKGIKGNNVINPFH